MLTALPQVKAKRMRALGVSRLTPLSRRGPTYQRSPRAACPDLMRAHSTESVAPAGVPAGDHPRTLHKEIANRDTLHQRSRHDSGG